MAGVAAGVLLALAGAALLPGLLSRTPAAGSPGTVTTTPNTPVGQSGASGGTAATVPASGASGGSSADGPQGDDSTQAVAFGTRPTGSGFMVVLESLKKSEWTQAQAKSIADSVLARGPSPVFLDTNQVTGLKPDFWVLGDGPYATEEAAVAACAAYGRAHDGNCYLRDITFVSTSHVTSITVPGDPQRAECQAIGASDPAGCRAVNAFLTAYAANEKSISQATVGDWWTDPADYYGTRPSPDDLAAKLSAPSKPGSVFLAGHLIGFSPSATTGGVSGIGASFLVPYRQNGILKTTRVDYIVVPGGPQAYRIARVADDS